jgi:hypothetical protein
LVRYWIIICSAAAGRLLHTSPRGVTCGREEQMEMELSW